MSKLSSAPSQTSPSEASLAFYRQGYGLMLEISEILNNGGDVALGRFQEAGDLLAQAIEADPNYVQPYVLLSSLFLTLKNRVLAEKYLGLAEKIDPFFPEIQKLKEIMMTSGAWRGKPKMGSDLDLKAMPIERLQSMEAPGSKAEKPKIGKLGHLFTPILPLLTTPLDFYHWVNSCFQVSLSENDSIYLYLAINGFGEEDLKTTTQRVSQILASIRPEFAKQISAFAKQLQASPQGLIRQFHLLFSPLKAKFASPPQLHQALEVCFRAGLSKNETVAFFQIMQGENLDAQVDPHLPILIGALQKILPGDQTQMDLKPMLEKLTAYAAELPSLEAPAAPAAPAGESTATASPPKNQHPGKVLQTTAAQLLQAVQHPRQLHAKIQATLGYDLAKPKTNGLFYFLQGQNLEGSGPFSPADLVKLQQILNELGLLDKEALKNTGELGRNLGDLTLRAVRDLCTRLQSI